MRRRAIALALLCSLAASPVQAARPPQDALLVLVSPRTIALNESTGIWWSGTYTSMELSVSGPCFTDELGPIPKSGSTTWSTDTCPGLYQVIFEQVTHTKKGVEIVTTLLSTPVTVTP